MLRKFILLAIIAVTLPACVTGGDNTRVYPGYPPLGDWVIFDTCTRNGSDCPGANPLPEGEYRVVGKTFIFRQPVIGYIVAFNGKTYARGRVYTDPTKGGQAFEGVWVDECNVRGRTGSSSSVFNLKRLDCLPPEEARKWVQ